MRKGFGSVDYQVEFFYIKLQVSVGKGKTPKEIGQSLVQELFNDLGAMGSNIVEPKLVCLIIDC